MCIGHVIEANVHQDDLIDRCGENNISFRIGLPNMRKTAIVVINQYSDDDTT